MTQQQAAQVRARGSNLHSQESEEHTGDTAVVRPPSSSSRAAAPPRVAFSANLPEVSVPHGEDAVRDVGVPTVGARSTQQP